MEKKRAQSLRYVSFYPPEPHIHRDFLIIVKSAQRKADQVEKILLEKALDLAENFEIWNPNRV